MFIWVSICVPPFFETAYISQTLYRHIVIIISIVKLKEGFTPDQVCADAGYDGITSEQCTALLNTHGVGFEGFWITV